MYKPLVSASIIFLCFVGYVQPFHSAPWPAAVNDGIFLILGLISIASTIAKPGPSGLRFSRKEILVIGLLTLHLGISSLLFDNRSAAPYALVVFISFLCYKAAVGNPTSQKLLVTGIWLAASVTAIIGIGQWLGAWDQFEGRFLWMLEIRPGSPMIGNLGQPNLTGTLMIWGLASALMLAAHLEGPLPTARTKQMALGLLSASMVLMTVASALTHSRTTTLAFLVITLLAWKHRTLYGPRAWRLTLAACALHLVLVAALPAIGHALFESALTTAYGGKGMISNTRLHEYAIFLRAIGHQPLFGYGMGGAISAFLYGVDTQLGEGIHVEHAHNLMLDLLVWFGVPLGLFFVFVFFYLIYRAHVRIKTKNDVALFSILVAVSIHAMLEFPLHYACFLIPSAIFLANFSYATPSQWFALPKSVAVMLLAGSGVVLALIANDYFRMEQEIRQARLELAITGRVHPPSDSKTLFLNELDGANVMLRTEASSNMSQLQLNLFEKTTAQFPMRYFIEKNIKALTLNGQADRANYWRNKDCAIYGLETCKWSPPNNIR